MIRWKYFIPRLGFFALFLALSTLSLNPLMHWSAVRTAESLAGTDVEIDRVLAKPLTGYIRLHGVRVIDRQSPGTNLVSVDNLQLSIDGRELSKRRFVVTNGVATGVRLGTHRPASDAVCPRFFEGYETALNEQFAAFGHKWLEQAAAQLSNELPPNLQSIGVANQLLSRWPREYKAVEAQASSMNGQIARIQRLIDLSGDNPLRNLDTYQHAIAELETVRSQTFELRSSLDRLRQQLRMDRDSLSNARKRDEAQITEKIQLEPFNSAELTEYLLGPELGHHLVTALKWLHWGRTQIPGNSIRPLAGRSRGQLVFFPGIVAKPETVISTLSLRGGGEFQGIAREITGVVLGWSSDPALSDDPIEIELATTGTRQMFLKATCDLRGDIRCDVVAVRFPELPQPARELGKSDQLIVNVSEANTQLLAHIKVVGDAIGGELILNQAGVRLTPKLNTNFGGAQVGDLVASALESVHRIEARVNISGKLDDPLWKLESNLGPALAAGITRAIRSHIDSHQQQLLAQKLRDVESRLNQLEHDFEAKQMEMLAQLETGNRQVASINKIIASRVDMNDSVIDKDSPLRESFLR